MDKKSVKPLEELLDSVRDIDGFPIGKDEDILALSDPPFYTACPNPYIKQFIEEYGKPYDPENGDYERTPYVGDVSEGKNDPIYNAHSYHTKVPHKAIMKYIEYYTEEGDIVFDGFCGTGMTGVAAQFTGRKAILSDLSPLATFIANNYNGPINLHQFEEESRNILKEVVEECGWMYETYHTKNLTSLKTSNNSVLFKNHEEKGKINYVIWSDLLICPYCKNEYVYWDAAVDRKKSKIKGTYECPICNAEIGKREHHRVKGIFYDSVIGQVNHTKYIPVLINYSVGKERFEKKPDQNDLKLIDEINHMDIPYWYPTYKIPKGVKTREPKNIGLTHIHQFYFKRNLWILSCILDKTYKKSNKFLASIIISFIENHADKRNKWIVDRNHPKGTPCGPLTNTLYISLLQSEVNIFDRYRKAMEKIIKAYQNYSNQQPVAISCQSSTNFNLIADNKIDYIFTDPPFGANIMYSELNFLRESWLKVMTNNKTEAIINDIQQKNLEDYKKLMTVSFKEMYRILKPNRWITVVFHNSKASVWNAIQEGMSRAGFIIAQVTVLDKKQGTLHQDSSYATVKNDLIINAYKPKSKFSESFLKNAGEGMEIDFVAQQLEHLPVKPNIGRTEKMLFSKMLAHYVENGFKIKYDATNFYKLLSDNFTELDGYWFLDRQVKEYNKWKSGLSLDQMKEVLGGQQVLFVSDEKSAITWMYSFLHTPRDYSEIYTAYQQVATITEDAVPEPRELLDNNFILENGKYRRPISREEKEEINKNRERELERAFNKLLKQAKEQKGKIRDIRQEALVHGFTKCYQEGRYQDILTVADRLYASTLESSGDIMDFVDIARIKTSGEKEVENYKG